MKPKMKSSLIVLSLLLLLCTQFLQGQARACDDNLSTHMERPIGDCAKNQTAALDGLIGRKFDDFEVERDFQFSAYNVMNNNRKMKDTPYSRKQIKGDGYSEEDIRSSERAYVRNKLERFLYNMKWVINDKEILADRIGLEDKESVNSALSEAFEWLYCCERPEIEDYVEKMRDVESICDPVLKRAYDTPSAQYYEEETFSDLEI